MPTLRRNKRRLLDLYGARPHEAKMQHIGDLYGYETVWEARRAMDRLVSTGEWDELSVYDVERGQHLYGWSRREMVAPRVAAD